MIPCWCQCRIALSVYGVLSCHPFRTTHLTFVMYTPFQRTIEIVSFGIPLYWMVGLVADAKAFFVYLALLIFYTVGLKMMFGILAQTLPKKANVQGIGTFLVLLLSLFGGFMVYPNVSAFFSGRY